MNLWNCDQKPVFINLARDKLNLFHGSVLNTIEKPEHIFNLGLFLFLDPEPGFQNKELCKNACFTSLMCWFVNMATSCQQYMREHFILLSCIQS